MRQSKADNYRTEVYVVPNAAADRAAVLAAVQARVAALQGQWPGVAVDERHGEIHLSIPETFRVGHEAHFAEVTRNFLGYLRKPRHAAGVGTPEHAGEVLRDDDRHGDEPQGAGQGGDADRAVMAVDGSIAAASMRRAASSRPRHCRAGAARRVVSCFLNQHRPLPARLLT